MSQGSATATTGAAVLIALALAAGGGYWAGQRKDGDSAAPAAASAPARQILYYRNPMGLPDTSPVPKKDPMGMDYLPVYAGEEEAAPEAAGQVKISPEKIQKLGVRTEAVALRSLDKVVRVSGRVEADESRTYAIAPKFEGYVERLHVNVTGQPVGKGQALFEAYSPELVSAQREYAIAAQGADSLQGSEAQVGMRQLAESSLARLRNWDVSPDQVKALARNGEARRTLTFRSPVSGVITERKAVQGMRFMPGETLYQVADLSAVWVVADVFEQDLAQARVGGRATVRLDAYPGKTFTGSIAYVYPTLNAATRSVPVRVELANPGLLLKPGMFAQVELAAPKAGPVLAVPASAVIDSGRRQVVLVEAGAGRFEPRPVKLGVRGDDYVAVLDGLRAGESVVVSANFLIDAESNLKAALGGLGQAAPAAPAKVGHHAEGKVMEADPQAGTVSIAHGPVASLKWPAMTMEFAAANGALLHSLKPGASIAFEFVERGPGEWVITAATPLAAAGASPSGQAPAAHAGH